MKQFTQKEIEQRAIDWDLDIENEDDLKLAEESLYCDNRTIVMDILNDGII